MLRIATSVMGSLLLLTGGIWFLQGMGILPGSYMTGQSEWAFYGGVAMIAGVALLVLANRRHGKD